jgi:hypothetical protein
MNHLNHALGETMKTMCRILFAIALFAVASGTASAQALNIYGVNALSFPKITADYIALDATGNPITDLRAADFRVTETQQGGAPIDVTASVTHECDSLVSDPEASIIIILDRSQSMDDPVEGRKRFDFAKDAIKSFVEQLKFAGETRVSLVTFSGTVEVTVEWANSAKPIIDSLRLMKTLTNTNYVLPFEHKTLNIYDLFKKRPSNLPKYVFFLTDGYPNPGIADVSETRSESKFIADNAQKLASQGIRFYSITILVPDTHASLAAFAKATGGKSIVTNEGELVSLMSFLALETQVRKICRISWISSYTCTEQGRNRTAGITMLRGVRPTTNVQFVTPPSSVSSVEVSDPVLFCGDPAPNQVSFANVTLTARGATFAATEQTLNPSTYFRVVDWNFPFNQPTFAPFNLAPGAKRVIRVEFKQGAAKNFRQAELAFTGFPCPPKVTLVGGTGVVLLQSPVGGELFSTCDTVLIKWAGVLPTQPVSIDYSEDGGATWKPIEPAATGLVYKWLPPRSGTNYKVRVSVSPVQQYAWATQLGGFGDETPTSVAVIPSGVKVFATGFFEGNTRFGNVAQNGAAGNLDGYFVEMDSDGKIIDPSKVLLLVGTASNEEKIVGCVVDNKGNYYVAGYFSSPAVTFGPYLPNRGPLDTRNFFVFKFDSTGMLDWQAGSKGTATQSSHAMLTDIGLRYDAAGNVEVIAAGKFQRFVEVGRNSLGAPVRSQTFPNATDRDFHVIYDTRGDAQFFAGTKPTTGTGLTYQSLTATDRLGFTYKTDAYRGPITFSPPEITLGNNSGPGSDDVYVYKNGAAPASNDVSDNVFSVKSPQLEFRPNRVTFSTIQQGQSTTKTAVLSNIGNFDVTVKSVVVAGANAGDFTLAGNIVGQVVPAGKSLNIELIFSPKGVGTRSALIEVAGTCGSPVQLSVDGLATAPCDVETNANVDQGKVPLGQPRTMKITCMIKNVGSVAINGNLRVTVPNPDIVVRNVGPFTLAPNGGCFDVDIDVPAASPGVKTTTINFGLPPELCGEQVATIKVEIVEPRVTIDNVDLGLLRVLTPGTGAISISNLNSEEAEITSITLTDPSNPNFAFTLPAPRRMAAGEVVKVPVTYTPQTRGMHSAGITVVIKGKESSPLTGVAKGSGFLPAIQATGYRFSPWTVSTTSPESGKVVIRNTDATSDLVISTIAFETPSAAFAWSGALPQLPITLKPNSAPLELPVSFTPQVIGNNRVNVRISHDAKTGPGPVPPYADTLVVLEGIGRDASSLDPISFPKTLTCATRNATFTITNNSTQFDLTCQAPIGTGDVGAFVLDQTTGFVLKPGESKVITVTFQPSVIGRTSATFNIPNDQSLKLTVSVDGEGVTTPVQFSFGTIGEGRIGQLVALPISVSYNAAEFTGAKPQSFAIALTHNPDAMRFRGFTSQQMNGWTFTPTAAVGRVDIAAQSTGGTLEQGVLVTPTFDVFLNADSSLPVQMTVTTPLNCLVPVGDRSAVTMAEVCFTEGRLVNFGSNRAGLAQPLGNPVRDIVTIPYTTGLTLSTSFQIVNAMGDVVIEAHSPVVPSGAYQLTVNVSSLANGTYFVRMLSGPFTATTSFNVLR